MIDLLVMGVAPLLLDVRSAPCAKYKSFAQPEIIFEIVEKPIEYNYRNSRKALTARSKESIKEWLEKNKGHAWLSDNKARHSEFHTNGITRGGFNVRSNVQFMAKPYDKFGAYYCPLVTKAHITIEYSTEIYIASDFKKGTCEFNAIMEHELRHYETNKVVVRTIADRMKADTPEIIGFLQEQYVPKERVEENFELMREGFRDAIQVYSDEIISRMDEFNDHVDTPEEYRRVGNLCKK